MPNNQGNASQQNKMDILPPLDVRLKGKGCGRADMDGTESHLISSIMVEIRKDNKNTALHASKKPQNAQSTQI